MLHSLPLVSPSCLGVGFERASLVAGFTDGSVVLTKGDITRDRHSKTMTLHEGNSPITGLAFRQVAKATHLFVATLENVYVSLLAWRRTKVNSQPLSHQH